MRDETDVPRERHREAGCALCTVRARACESRLQWGEWGRGEMVGELVDWSAFGIQPCLVFICLLAVWSGLAC